MIAQENKLHRSAEPQQYIETLRFSFLYCALKTKSCAEMILARLTHTRKKHLFAFLVVRAANAIFYRFILFIRCFQVRLFQSLEFLFWVFRRLDRRLSFGNVRFYQMIKY